ncbi:MAG: T9SS type A sorting domain-containing protein [bacterium]|nr:T9SS type A sorting domain-containing protein [bacterium]
MKKIFIILVLLTPIQAFSWTPPVQISNSGVAPAVTSDKRGWIHVVWWCKTKINEARYDHIFYSCNSGTGWSSPLDISPNATGAGNVAITTDTLNWIHVTWTDFGPYVGKLYYTYYNGTNWATPICMAEILPNCSALGTSDLICDSLNNLHLVWSGSPDIGGNTEIFYSKFDGHAWSYPINVSNDLPHSAKINIAIDLKDNLHVVWQDYTGNYGVRYSKYNGTSWSPSVLLPDISPGQSVYPRIGIDTFCLPHVVWEERTPGPAQNEIVYTHYEGDTWCPCTLLFTAEIASQPVIVSDSQNRVYVVWTGLGGLYYSFWENGSWSQPDTIPSAKGYADLTIDKIQTTLHLVWYSHDGIWYSRHNLLRIEEKLNHTYGFMLDTFPNPCYGGIKIYYSLSKFHSVNIIISDIAGQVIDKVDLGYQSSGEHKFVLPLGRFKKGGILCSGVYFLTLKAGGRITTRKVVVVH